MFRNLDKSQSFPDMETRLQKLWEADDSFRKSVAARPADKTFIFNDGPPFATGLPHYGHLLAGTIKDIVPRYWTMKGYRVERRFGWDCHGLPIENLIQDKLNLKTVRNIHEYGVDKFNEACRASVLTYTAEWRKTVGRMGRWVDFDNEYKTMDASFMESVWWVFKQCFDKGLIYQGYRIQPYSPALATSLSNFEVNQAYRDRQDPSVTLAFPLEAGASHASAHGGEGGDESILVWTTTPWTLPSNMAIALHPDLDYTLVRFEGKKYWIAEARRLAYFPEAKAPKKSKDGEAAGAPAGAASGGETPRAEVLETRKGRDFAGRRYKPLFQYMPYMTEKQYTILMADFVSADDGAGSVHIAPSFGEEDFQLGKAEGLGLFDPLDAEGKFTHLVPEWQGVGAKDADKSILQHLKAQGRVFKHETLVHSYPHCWRTDVPLLYRAQKNWFLSLEKEITSAPDASSAGVTKTLKQWMIDSNQQINWVPDHIKGGRFGKWLEGARDWNLSRNRFWGTCIPIWLADDGDMLCVGSVAELEALTGKQVSDLHKHIVDPLVIRTKDKKTFDAAGKEYRRTPEVLDCWFESGSMPYAQSHYPFENKDRFANIFPADFIAEGLDQTRGWFYTLTVLGAALFQKPAFKNVIVNGILLAEDGQKMSKRLKNYPNPNELIDRTSADAIRLFMIDSAAVKAEELKFSETGVKNITRAVLLPLWNSLSLFVTYANADADKGQLTWRPGQELKSENELDRWILSDLQQLLGKVQAEMDAYRLFNVVPAVVEFIDDLTNWYIRRSRRRFWKSEDDQDKNFAYATLYHVLVEFSKVLAPFLPFLAEELYQILVREPAVDGTLVKTAANAPGGNVPVSVHLCDFPVVDKALLDSVLNAKMARVRHAVNLGRSLRSQHNLKNRQPLRKIIVVVRDERLKSEILDMEALIQEELNVKEVEVSLDESSLVTYKGKANFKSLGARLGKAMKSVAEKVAKLSHEEIKSVLSGIPLAVEEGELRAEDILVVRETREGLVVEASPELTVALDTAVDHGLRLEMLARESVSKIQNLRKDSGFEVTDRIAVNVKTVSPLFREALETHFTYITAEVLASSLGFSEAVREEDGNSLDINGEIAVFSVSKKV